MLVAKRKDKEGNTHELSLVVQEGNKENWWRYQITYFKSTNQEEKHYTFYHFKSKLEALARLNDVLFSHDFEVQESVLFSREFIGSLQTAITCLEDNYTEQREIATYYLKQFLRLVY